MGGRVGVVPMRKRSGAGMGGSHDLAASPALARRAEAFAEAVLLPLAAIMELPLTAIAVGVGPGIGRGRNVRGLICLALDRFEVGAPVDRAGQCRWFCELCRLLAEN